MTQPTTNPAAEVRECVIDTSHDGCAWDWCLMHGRKMSDCRRLVNDTEAAPPEHIYVNERAAAVPMNGVYTLSKHEGDLEYILRSSHEAEVSKLREALRGLVNHGDDCWCVDAPDPDDVEGHTTYCAAARNAIGGE